LTAQPTAKDENPLKVVTRKKNFGIGLLKLARTLDSRKSN